MFKITDLFLAWSFRIKQELSSFRIGRNQQINLDVKVEADLRSESSKMFGDKRSVPIRIDACTENLWSYSKQLLLGRVYSTVA